MRLSVKRSQGHKRSIGTDVGFDRVLLEPMLFWYARASIANSTKYNFYEVAFGILVSEPRMSGAQWVAE